MALTETAIRAAKPGDKPKKLSDEKGMFLLLQPSGGKLWRLKYRFGGKEKKFSIGRYPDVGLKEARSRRDEARRLIADGIDPSEHKQAKERAAKLNAANTFEAIANEYLVKSSKEGRAAVTIKKSQWLLSLMLPALGDRPIVDISAAELLGVLQKVEAEGHLETARRMKSLASRIFRFAVATSRASTDPAAVLRGALASPIVKHHSAILDPEKLGGLLRAIEGFDGQPLTCLALRLTPHVFVRPGMLRKAEWPEFDLKSATWTLSEGRMKMRRPHVVPLSRQALQILKDTRALSANQKYVFSSLYPGNRPMSENTINAALRRMGFSQTEMTAHGFRATASTLLNEFGKWSADAIERALAHKDSSVRGIYHRSDHWAERVEMAQWWSDYLDGLRKSVFESTN